ncbi:hypothetical protein L1887_35096 [Cichorium endivia]|nr:hypothetical protein L1887_35096 [Cichorium endivia]
MQCRRTPSYHQQNYLPTNCITDQENASEDADADVFGRVYTFMIGLLKKSSWKSDSTTRTRGFSVYDPFPILIIHPEKACCIIADGKGLKEVGKHRCWSLVEMHGRIIKESMMASGHSRYEQKDVRDALDDGRKKKKSISFASSKSDNLCSLVFFSELVFSSYPSNVVLTILMLMILLTSAYEHVFPHSLHFSSQLVQELAPVVVF